MPWESAREDVDTSKHGPRMNNVIKFQKPKPVKPPRQTPPWQKKAIAWALIVMGLVAAWGYFYMTQQPAGVTP
jgi:hypothetical protein